MRYGRASDLDDWRHSVVQQGNLSQRGDRTLAKRIKEREPDRISSRGVKSNVYVTEGEQPTHDDEWRTVEAALRDRGVTDPDVLDACRRKLGL